MDQLKANSVVRLSLRWVLVAFIAVLAVGVLGGMIGSTFNRPLAPLNPEQNQLVSTVQEVTISPSKAAQSIVQEHERSVILLAQGTLSNPTIIGPAAVVTNDGLVVSFHVPVRGDVFGIDNGGSQLNMEVIGSDILYGLTYYRIRDGVIAPLNITESDPRAGAELLSLSRSSDTLQPKAEHHQLLETLLADSNDPVGWQKLGSISLSQLDQSGALLLDDIGTISGIFIGPQSGTSGRLLLASDIRTSLNRISTGRREENPFVTRGFTVQSAFTSTPTEALTFTVTVDRVQPGTPAEDVLHVGDVIVAVENQPVSFASNISSLISTEGPLTLTVRRATKEQVVTLQ